MLNINHFVLALERIITEILLLGIVGILFAALIIQLTVPELPCPLCILQRIGFLCIAFGFLLNLRFGPRPSHYTIVLISSLFTSFVALRQIALHVIPGTGFYGSAIFGLHLYTWSCIASIAIAIVTVLLLGMDRQYRKVGYAPNTFKFIRNLLFTLVIILILLNIGSTVLECGFTGCPDNPTQYKIKV